MTKSQTMQFQAQVTGASFHYPTLPIFPLKKLLADHQLQPANVVVGANATTISVLATNGTRISYSSALRTTQTRTSTHIVKSAMSEAPAAPAAKSITPPTIPILTLAQPSTPVVSLIPTAAAQGAGGDEAETDATTTVNETVTIRSTSTRTITVLAASTGMVGGANETGMYQ